MNGRLTGLIVLAWLTSAIRSCPTACVCKWRNGKQTVECNNKGLLSVPSGMDQGTQVLEFSGNNVEALREGLFATLDLTNLQRIYMARCGIRAVDGGAFKGLTNLVELDLSGNALEAVPSDIFLDCPSLMRLTLSRNPIRELRKGAFNHLSFLSALELSGCEIESAEEGAFLGLHSLEWLHLDGNRLTRLRGERPLPDTLKGVELQGNRWECDCKMRDLHAWLLKFNIPQSVEPICSGPGRLSGRAIKLIQTSELACLPDVSPTAFYLEIGEGKNISLVCHVRAVPEARVSWWFHGQVIQNDTMIAPGIHVVYHVEEGGDDKCSELFIYNTNPDDNGTFVCSAENAAGASHSNFTIRIIVREEPVMVVVAFPFEDLLLAAVLGAAALVLVAAIMVAVLILKCRRNRRRQQKRDKTKEVALQYQRNASKCVLRENAERLPESLKGASAEGGGVGCEAQELVLYGVRANGEQVGSLSPAPTANQVGSPSSLRHHYQLEQNPDLINDAESVGRRRDGDGDEGQGAREPAEGEQINPLMHQTFLQFPVTCLRSGREIYGRWDPACLFDSEGYPVDYGLPKIQSGAAAGAAQRYYRTLPHNRANKRQSAANPPSRYSREAEFLSRTTHAQTYESYEQDVRYTADGYPAKQQGQAADVAAAPISLPCCSNPQWPSCVPANLHTIDPAVLQPNYASVSKRCVGAQTEAGSAPEEAPQPSEAPACDPLTESPDEGYEGEPSVVV